MRTIILLSCCLAGTALAQNRGGAESARQMRAQTSQQQGFVPLNFDRLSRERVPPLRSWVQGWALTGSRPDAYEVRCDDTFSSCGMPIFRTRSGVAPPLGTGSLSHSESAEPWRGMRLKVHAELRAGRIDGWAGLWLRIDDAQGQVLAFDNMQSRAIRGTSGFAKYEVVLDVPQSAERLSLGVLLHGPGALWIRELDLEPVDDTVPTTDLLPSLRKQGPAVAATPSGGAIATVPWVVPQPTVPGVVPPP